MTEQMTDKKPWERDPTERGLQEPHDITNLLVQQNRCARTCRLLGTSAYICAAELRFPDLRARTMLMKTCEGTLAAGGTQPRHGLRS